MARRNNIIAHEIEYHDAMITVLELIWGEGFMAPGGEGNVAHLIDGLDIQNKRILDIGCGALGFKRMKMGYIYLAVAIFAEIIATSALKATEEFTKLVPSLIVIIGYGVAFYFMTLTLRTIPVGIMYALWSGLAIIFITTAGAVIYQEIPDAPAVIGIGFIVVGVIIINVFSKMAAH